MRFSESEISECVNEKDAITIGTGIPLFTIEAVLCTYPEQLPIGFLEMKESSVVVTVKDVIQDDDLIPKLKALRNLPVDYNLQEECTEHAFKFISVITCLQTYIRRYSDKFRGLTTMQSIVVHDNETGRVFKYPFNPFKRLRH